jgi:hypothetical protein
MIIFYWLFTFVLSWLNAWGVGKTWTETKATGGPQHFMSWMGATMAAVGFTWCYTILLGFVGTQIPIENEETGISAPLLNEQDVSVLLDLAYVIIIFPLIGSGMAITTHSWGVFWRRRSLSSGVTAGWNTYAQLSNFYSAMDHLPGAFDNISDHFGSSGSSSSSDDHKGTILLVLVVAAVAGGVLTTVAIIRSTARATAFERLNRYDREAESEYA